MKKKPNIIFVHVDQLKYSAITSHGCKYVKTPCMDRILKDGVNFKRSYAGVPVCVPARTCWYTGLEPEQSGVISNAQPLHDPDNVHDLGSWLAEKAGYESLYIGKWHVAKRHQDTSFRILHGNNPVGEYGDTANARGAADFLLNYNGEKPFFLNVGLLNPHDICYWNWSYTPAKFAMIDQIRHLLPPFPENYDKSKDSEGWTADEWRFYAYSYFRFVEMVDAEIGRIYRAYLNSPQRDNTVFIFSSDHGQGNGEHGWTTKNGPYEHSVNVPLSIIDPEARARRDTTHYITGIDIAPTICDYAGVERMPRNNGLSFKPLVRGEKTEWRDWMAVSSSMLRHRVVFKDNYKLIYDRSSKTALLFDLKRDPKEMKDLSGDPGYATILATMNDLRIRADKEREYAPGARKEMERYG